MVRLRVHLLLLVVHTQKMVLSTASLPCALCMVKIAFQTVYIYCICTAHGLEHFILHYSLCMYTENISQGIT